MTSFHLEVEENSRRPSELATPSESPKKIEVDGVQLASESPKLGGKKARLLLPCHSL